MSADPKSKNGKTKMPPRSAIVESAESLDHAVIRYEALVQEVQRASLTTKKGIERAAGLTREAGTLGEDMGKLVAALASAIGEMSSRQNAQSQALLERTHEIRARMEAMGALSDRFASLAAETAKINGEVQDFGKLEGATDTTKSEFLHSLRDKMQPVVDQAKELAKDAQDATFPEIVKQAESLAQTIASARNKVELAAKKLGG